MITITLQKDNIPAHVAIIMDGNGRWAKRRHLPRTAGHSRGVRVVEQIIEVASEVGVKVLTLYAFSTENWNRPTKEVSMLLNTLHSFLKHKFKKLMRNNIKLRFMGDINKFPDKIKKLLLSTQEDTKHNSRLTLNLALNYGGRYEILEATKKVAHEVVLERLSINNIDEDTFSKFLYTKDLPDPDLLIRTSGEMRISNFMLWQLSYAEFYFCNKFWPDFSKSDFKHAIAEYQKRERRFGGLDVSN
ncbi:isoprenyl transferase [Thermoproteota archaeon]